MTEENTPEINVTPANEGSGGNLDSPSRDVNGLNMFNTIGGVRGLKMSDIKKMNEEQDSAEPKKADDFDKHMSHPIDISDLLRNPDQDDLEEKLKLLETQYDAFDVKTLGGTKVKAKLFAEDEEETKEEKKARRKKEKKEKRKKEKKEKRKKRKQENKKRKDTDGKDTLDDGLKDLLQREEEDYRKSVHLEMEKKMEDERTKMIEELRMKFDKTTKEKDTEIRKLKGELRKSTTEFERLSMKFDTLEEKSRTLEVDKSRKKQKKPEIDLEQTDDGHDEYFQELLSDARKKNFWLMVLVILMCPLFVFCIPCLCKAKKSEQELGEKKPLINERRKK